MARVYVPTRHSYRLFNRLLCSLWGHEPATALGRARELRIVCYRCDRELT